MKAKFFRRALSCVISVAILGSVQANTNAGQTHLAIEESKQLQDHTAQSMRVSLNRAIKQHGDNAFSVQQIKLALSDTLIDNGDINSAWPLLKDVVTVSTQQDDMIKLRIAANQSLYRITQFVSDSVDPHKVKHQRNAALNLAADLRKIAQQDTAYAAEQHYVLMHNFNTAGPIPMELNEVLKITRNAETALIDQFGKQDSRTVEAIFTNAKLLQDKKRHEQAAEKFSFVVQALDNDEQKLSEMSLAARSRLVKSLDKLGRHKQADSMVVEIAKLLDSGKAPQLLYGNRHRLGENLRTIQVSTDGLTASSALSSPGISPKYAHVFVNFDINERGFIENVQVSDRSMGSVAFTKSIVDSLHSWRYSPKLEDGEPVRVVGHEASFTIDNR